MKHHLTSAIIRAARQLERWAALQKQLDANRVKFVTTIPELADKAIGYSHAEVTPNGTVLFIIETIS